MKKNYDLPAYPTEIEHTADGKITIAHGCTKLELASFMAMQGLLARFPKNRENTFGLPTRKDLAKESIFFAKELLTQLDNEKA